jgi:hypothetical protein
MRDIVGHLSDVLQVAAKAVLLFEDDRKPQ